ncbi:MAG: hypothetical protein HXS53_07425 [Theionarchaea archaeon]|nr:hypothetical protein [Theionarchaea archaeon]
MIITTSRRPHARSRVFCKELEGVIPLSLYTVRGKRGMRDLFSLSVEKGADRLLVITSHRDPFMSLRFYKEWTFLGELSISVQLRRELGIPPLKKIGGDPPLVLKSSDTDGHIIASFFGALLTREETDVWMEYEDHWIDFYRSDVSHTWVGPRIQVRTIHEHHN